jgi:hypothetical protein
MQKGRSFQDFEAFEARFHEILLVVNRHDYGEAGARLLSVGLGSISRGSCGRTQPTPFVETAVRHIVFDSRGPVDHAGINSTRVSRPKSAVDEFGGHFTTGIRPFGDWWYE